MKAFTILNSLRNGIAKECNVIRHFTTVTFGKKREGDKRGNSSSHNSKGLVVSVNATKEKAISKAFKEEKMLDNRGFCRKGYQEFNGTYRCQERKQ